MYKNLSIFRAGHLPKDSKTGDNKFLGWLYPRLPIVAQQLIPSNVRVGLLPNYINLKEDSIVDSRQIFNVLFSVNFKNHKLLGQLDPYNYLMVTSLVEDKDLPKNIVHILRNKADEFEYWRFFGDSRDNWLMNNCLGEVPENTKVFRVDSSFDLSRYKMLSELDELQFNTTLKSLIDNSETKFLYTYLSIQGVEAKIKSYVLEKYKIQNSQLPTDDIRINNSVDKILSKIMFIKRLEIEGSSEHRLHVSNPMVLYLKEIEAVLHGLIGNSGLRTSNYFPQKFDEGKIEKPLKVYLESLDKKSVSLVEELYYNYFDSNLNYNLEYHDFELLFWAHPVYDNFIDEKESYNPLNKIYANAIVNLMKELKESLKENFSTIDKKKTHFFLNKVLININQIQLSISKNIENNYQIPNFFQLIASDIFEIVKGLPINTIDSFSSVDQIFLDQHFQKLSSFKQNGGTSFSAFTSSGSRAFSIIIESIKDYFSDKFEVHHFNDIYYEFSALLRQLKYIDTKLVFEEDIISSNSNLHNVNVMCLDLRPNSASEKTYQPHNVADLLQKLQLDAKHHKIIVIDTTTVTPQEPIFKEQFNMLLEAVDKGCISVISHQSLNKFQLLGLDIAPGGLIRVFSKDNNLVKALQENIFSHKPDVYSSSLYELFIKTCSEIVFLYQQLIIENTNNLFKLFVEKGLTEVNKDTGVLYVGDIKGEDIPSYLAIHFNFECIKNIFQLDKDKLFDEEFKYNLLLFVLNKMIGYMAEDCNERSSFGFAKTNINDCQVSLRITISPIFNRQHLEDLCHNLEKVSEEIISVAKKLVLENEYKPNDLLTLLNS